MKWLAVILTVYWSVFHCCDKISEAVMHGRKICFASWCQKVTQNIIVVCACGEECLQASEKANERVEVRQRRRRYQLYILQRHNPNESSSTLLLLKTIKV